MRWQALQPCAAYSLGVVLRVVLFVLLALLAVQGSKASYLESGPEVETVEVVASPESF